MSKILETASSLSGPRSEEAGAHSNPGSLLPFVYEPLDLEKQVFRLIRVQKREGNGPIEIEMWHSEMSTQYRCLSYMWGEETQTYGLLLNGKSFGVRKNLYHFLEFASRVYPEETLWIDAICIDQTNIAERGHQVQRMGAIYSKADEVLVWLSECRAFLKSKFGEWSDVKRLTKSPDCVQLECYPDDDEQMAQLCSNPYWNRAWIAQEILLQRNVRILFNGHDLFMPWPSLGNALPRTPDWQTKTTPQLSMVRGLLNTWYERHGHSIADMSEMKWNRALSIRPNQTITPSIWDLLATRATAACSDSRDRVYSLVALLHQEANQRLVVDYGENKSDFLLRLLTTLKGWHIPGRIALLICAL
ncbi:heterokaryon incompatibility protein-domain-containing protein, partial [Paraphoma chrysanthemicola]